MADYEKLSKEQLSTEIDLRRASGRAIDLPAQPKKEDLVYALTKDDEDSDSGALPGNEDPFAELPATGFQSPTDKEYKESGKAYVSTVDGETYLLVVREDAADGKTHFLKNRAHFENCTKEEFRKRFEKK